MSSLKTNVVLNFVNTLTGIIFPVITFPYAARILLPEGIGTVNFLQSIVNYIVLLTSLGIPMYAVREVARYRDNEHKRNVTTVEIILLSVVLCLGGYVIVWLLGEYVPQINAQLALFYVLSLTILFTSLGVNWFYQAIEDFKFITVRALVFRLLAMISLFIFVKTKDDLLAYALISVGATVGNNIINFIHLRKYVSFRQFNWSELRIWRHLRPSLHIFVFNLITSIYLNLNTVMLGFMQGDSAVGLYTAGNKISHIALTVVASLGVVMLPRCANLIERGQLDEFASVTGKSYRFVTALSLPVTLGLMLLAVPVIALFCGQEFSDAVPVLYWTAPVIIFISLSNVFGIQLGHLEHRGRCGFQFHFEPVADSSLVLYRCGNLHFRCRIGGTPHTSTVGQTIHPVPDVRQESSALYAGCSGDGYMPLAVVPFHYRCLVAVDCLLHLRHSHLLCRALAFQG